jgi:glycosyltransferase involved in cell wall biosynthesis
VRDGETGVCIKARDREALFGAMERLIQNKEQCSAYGQTGRKWVIDKFQPAVIVEDLMQLYSNHPPLPYS